MIMRNRIWIGIVLVIPGAMTFSIFEHIHDIISAITGEGKNGCQHKQTNDCHAAFGYNHQSCTGPDEWQNISSCFKLCGSKKRQSPINIKQSTTKIVPSLPPLVLVPYMAQVTVKISNNYNHAPEFERVENDVFLNLFHPVMPKGRFRFKQMHIHLGSSPNKGSEHSINGRFTPMEAHLVFQNIDIHHDFKEAQKLPEGLLAIGVFLELYNDTLPPPTAYECMQVTSQLRNNEALAGLYVKSAIYPIMFNRLKTRTGSFTRHNRTKRSLYIDRDCASRKTSLSRILQCAFTHSAVKFLKKSKSQREISELNLKISPEDFLPPWFCRQYYTYKGSLTTPPCYENVQWIIMDTPIRVSHQVLESLQKIDAYGGGKTLSYFGTDRPIQSNRMCVFKSLI